MKIEKQNKKREERDTRERQPELYRAFQAWLREFTGKVVALFRSPTLKSLKP
jgi:hypothetical protein